MGQFGNTFDEFGRRFVCTNRNHLIPILYPDHLVKPNPNLPPPPPTTDNQETGGAAKIFPISRNFTTASHHSGTFSASCGIMVYRGLALGEADRGSIFTCDPTGNLVHQEILEPHGAGFTWHPPHDGVEFLASSDDWFRPVSLAHGPDDALYVVDMYRAVIEHPEWMPPELRNRPDLHDGSNMGRLWRVRGQVQKPGVPPASLTTAALVQELESPNAWRRMTAFRLLLQRGGLEPTQPLRHLIETSKVPEAVTAAAWLLNDLNAIDPATLASTLQPNTDPRVREQIPSLLTARSKSLPDRSLAILDTLAHNDPDPRVRFQTALALSWTHDDQNVDRLAAITLKTFDHDPWTRRAVLNALNGHELAFLLKLTESDLLFRTDNFAAKDLWTETARLIGSQAQPASVSALVELLQLRPVPDPFRIRALAAANDGLATRGHNLRDTLNDPSLANDPRSQSAANWATNFLQGLIPKPNISTRPDPDTLDTIRLLAILPPHDARVALRDTLQGSSDPTIQITAARTLAGILADSDLAVDLLEAWPNAGPSLRRGLASLLAANPARAARLLDAVESSSVAPADLDLNLVKSLVNTGPDDLRTRARSILASRLPADRSTVLNRYQAALNQRGDIDRGRAVFRRAAPLATKSPIWEPTSDPTSATPAPRPPPCSSTTSSTPTPPSTPTTSSTPPPLTTARSSPASSPPNPRKPS